MAAVSPQMGSLGTWRLPQPDGGVVFQLWQPRAVAVQQMSGTSGSWAID